MITESFDARLMPRGHHLTMPHTFTVYILASLSRRLYVGITGDLIRKLHEHRTATLPNFTARYRINRLVHFEQTSNARAAIQRETEIKQWSREKKVQLIETTNAGWLDLSEGWFTDTTTKPVIQRSPERSEEPEESTREARVFRFAKDRSE